MPVAGMTYADVAVVGGGPAGTSAAITLARAGRHVVLVDKAHFPRDKCCGDGLTTGALRSLDRLGFDPADVASWQWVDEAWVRSPEGRLTHLPMPRTAGRFGAVARRVDLDAALLRLARSAGVEVCEGYQVTSAAITTDGNAVRLDGEQRQAPRPGNPQSTLAAGSRPPVGSGLGGSLSARYVIAADGVWSPLRKMLGVDDGERYLGDWHAFRQYFRTPQPLNRGMWVIFEGDLVPGYVWSFPLADGKANLGFGVRRRSGTISTGQMSPRWDEIIDRPHIKLLLGEGAEPESDPKSWPIPTAVASTVLSAGRGRVLFAGDAARCADPMTGEGIAQAVDTGVLAARSVLAAGPSDCEQAAWRYRRVVARGMAVDHRLSEYFSSMLEHGDGGDRSARLLAKSSLLRRNFVRWMFEDYPRAVLRTPHRWTPTMFSSPGPFARNAIR